MSEDALTIMRGSNLMDDAVKTRFFAKIKVTDYCWEWTAGKSSQRPSRAYGVFCVGGTLFKAHRLAWELFNNQRIPPQMVACHHCDNPCCVNPLHIFVGTSKDNAADVEKKGRMYHHKGVLREFCRRGHPLSKQNTYVYPKSGDRVCKTCRAMRESVRTR